MKYFKDEKNDIFAYESDGSQDHLIDGKTQISQEEAKELLDIKEKARYEALPYQLKRQAAYPPIGDFVDAIVKQDEVAVEEYRQKCLKVKEMYPKS